MHGRKLRLKICETNFEKTAEEATPAEQAPPMAEAVAVASADEAINEASALLVDELKQAVTANYRRIVESVILQFAEQWMAEHVPVASEVRTDDCVCVTCRVV